MVMIAKAQDSASKTAAATGMRSYGARSYEAAVVATLPAELLSTLAEAKRAAGRRRKEGIREMMAIQAANDLDIVADYLDA